MKIELGYYLEENNLLITQEQYWWPDINFSPLVQNCVLTRLIGLSYCGTEAYKDAVTFFKIFKLFCLGFLSNQSL